MNILFSKLFKFKSKTKYLFLILLFCNMIPKKESIKPSWEDLPSFHLTKITLSDCPPIKRVENMIIKYHKIDKTKLPNIKKRINLLTKISNYIEDNINISIMDSYQKNILLSIYKISISKIKYLKKLLLYYEKYNDNFDSLKSFFKDYKPTKYKVITIYEKEFYVSSLRDVIGGYWIECVDPCHRRYLVNYRLKWSKIKDKNKPMFFLWLENQIINSNMATSYFPKEIDILMYHIPKIEDGKIYLKSLEDNKYYLLNTPMDNKEGHVFTIAPNQELRIGLGSAEMRHSSLSKGKPVLGAGAFWFKKGIIKKISFSSGHYMPKFVHFYQTIEILKNKKLLLRDDIEVEYYDGPRRKVSSLPEFLKIIKSKLRK